MYSQKFKNKYQKKNFMGKFAKKRYVQQHVEIVKLISNVTRK